MEPDRLIITDDDVANAGVNADDEPPPPAISKWRRVATGALVLIPPALFLICLVDLVRSYRKGDAIRHAFAMHYWGVLIACCALWSILAVGGLLWIPGNPAAPVSIQQSSFSVPTMPPPPPVEDELTAREIARQFSPLVVTIFHPNQLPTSTPDGFGFAPAGAGAIAFASADGYLVITSHHVVDSLAFRSGLGQEVGVSLQDNQRALAELVGIHNELDLALLWVERSYGESRFAQPMRPFSSIEVGEPIFAIGHPAGFAFTISSGLVAQKRGGDLVQISAPISPGNSGGPVFDSYGRLLGIVQSVIDKEINPNAENLNFAVRVDDLRNSDAWSLDEKGLQALQAYSAKNQEADALETNANPEETKDTEAENMEGLDGNNQRHRF